MITIGSKKLSTALQWLDDHLLLLLGGFLLAFIPLYPKLPIFEIIPGYIVRVRLEDLFVFLTAGIWVIQLIRKKARWHTPLTWLIVAYAVIGLLSTLSAVLITKTVPMELLHVGKSLLHYLRYLQYFSLFFILVSAVQTRRHLKILVSVIVITLVAIGIYGIGQKHFYWPVYSTMNREFSKGIRLYLTEHARVQSTFGGHYDLAAYVVVFLPLILTLALMVKRKLVAVGLWASYILGVWLIMVSSSRISFLAFLAGTTLVVVMLALKKESMRQKLTFFFSRLAMVTAISLIMVTAYGEDVYDRLLQSLEAYPTLHQTYHEVNGQRKALLYETIPVALGIKDLSRYKVEKPKNALSTQEAAVMVASDQQPTATRPSDVYVDVPDRKAITTTDEFGNETTSYIDVDRVFSENAMRYGLSLAIRLDTLWPRALAGFYRNPLLGSGYATLTKDTIEHFTEAESTDNNFLRTLGETGLLGFLTFYGAVIAALAVAFRLAQFKKPQTEWEQLIAISFIAATVGLLINAIYIDVFAASKVAFTYWAFAGLLVAAYLLPTPKTAPRSAGSTSSLASALKSSSRKENRQKNKRS
jgi:hypothetical protein